MAVLLFLVYTHSLKKIRPLGAKFSGYFITKGALILKIKIWFQLCDQGVKQSAGPAVFFRLFLFVLFFSNIPTFGKSLLNMEWPDHIMVLVRCLMSHYFVFLNVSKMYEMYKAIFHPKIVKLPLNIPTVGFLTILKHIMMFSIDSIGDIDAGAVLDKKKSPTFLLYFLPFFRIKFYDQRNTINPSSKNYFI